MELYLAESALTGSKNAIDFLLMHPEQDQASFDGPVRDGKSTTFVVYREMAVPQTFTPLNRIEQNGERFVVGVVSDCPPIK